MKNIYLVGLFLQINVFVLSAQNKDGWLTSLNSSDQYSTSIKDNSFYVGSNSLYIATNFYGTLKYDNLTLTNPDSGKRYSAFALLRINLNGKLQ
jgi:hypothetical protein